MEFHCIAAEIQQAVFSFEYQIRGTNSIKISWFLADETLPRQIDAELAKIGHIITKIGFTRMVAKMILIKVVLPI